MAEAATNIPRSSVGQEETERSKLSYILRIILATLLSHAVSVLVIELSTTQPQIYDIDLIGIQIKLIKSQYHTAKEALVEIAGFLNQVASSDVKEIRTAGKHLIIEFNKKLRGFIRKFPPAKKIDSSDVRTEMEIDDDVGSSDMEENSTSQQPRNEDGNSLSNTEVRAIKKGQGGSMKESDVDDGSFMELANCNDEDVRSLAQKVEEKEEIINVLTAENIHLVEEKENLKKLNRDLSNENSQLKTNTAAVNYPILWSSREDPYTPKLRLVPLSHRDQFYCDILESVSTRSMSRQGYEIVKIERTENFELFEKYSAARHSMNQRYKNTIETQQYLLHGTTKDAVLNITLDGFSTLHHGANGHKHGRGLYFTPLIEKAILYSRPDASDFQRVILAQVLTGRYTEGEKEDIKPPLQPENRAYRFDSTVDRLIDPTEFVIFDSCQVYPAYVISFLKK